MAGPYTPGNIELLGINYNREVKQIKLAAEVIKKTVTVQRSVDGTERFYLESKTALAGSTNLPRDATFFSDQIIIDDLDVKPRKYGIESRISYEDMRLLKANLPERTTMRTAHYIANAVNSRIYNVMTDSQSPASILTGAAGATWDNATRGSRVPQEDIAKAMAAFQGNTLQNFIPTTIYMNPYIWPFVVTNDYVMSSFDSSSAVIMQSGGAAIGRLLGLDVVVSNAVARDSVAVADPKEAVTWCEVDDLVTNVIDHPGKYTEFSAFSYGEAALLVPQAVYLITNTEA